LGSNRDCTGLSLPTSNEKHAISQSTTLKRLPSHSDFPSMSSSLPNEPTWTGTEKLEPHSLRTPMPVANFRVFVRAGRSLSRGTALVYATAPCCTQHWLTERYVGVRPYLRYMPDMAIGSFVLDSAPTSQPRQCLHPAYQQTLGYRFVSSRPDQQEVARRLATLLDSITSSRQGAQ